MPPSTVTVRVVASSATILAMGRTDRKSSVLLAIVLKQCRVPSTLSLLCLVTNSRTCSVVFAEYKRSVPYSRLPAQFVSLSPGIAASSGVTIGLAIIAEESLINVLLFMIFPSSALDERRVLSLASPRRHHQIIESKFKPFVKKFLKSDSLQHRS